jgi:hypothetical protein
MCYRYNEDISTPLYEASVMAQFNIDPEYLEERIEEALKKQKKVTRITLTAVSLGLFVLFNIIAWGALYGEGINAAGSALTERVIEQLTGGMIMLDVGWFLTLIYMLIPILMELPSADKANRARLTSRIMGEIVQESLRDGLTRPKRKRRDPDADLAGGEGMTIGDDGELIPEDEAPRRQTRR